MVRTKAELTALAEQIRDEVAINGNSKVRIYSILKDVIDTMVAAVGGGVALIRMGTFDASVNGGTGVAPIFPAAPTYPDTGAAGAVEAGNFWDVPLDKVGPLDGNGDPVFPGGCRVRARINAPGNTPANWYIET